MISSQQKVPNWSRPEGAGCFFYFFFIPCCSVSPLMWLSGAVRCRCF